MHFTVVPADSPGARLAITRYVEELQGVLPHGFTVAEALEGAARDYDAPRGSYLLAGPPEDPRAGGAITFIDADRAEVKRMWVSPNCRRQGVASALLGELERLTVASGRHVMVLDTSSQLAPAVSMYERRGYVRVAPYNDNPDADLWFRKDLGRPAQAG